MPVSKKVLPYSRIRYGQQARIKNRLGSATKSKNCNNYTYIDKPYPLHFTVDDLKIFRKKKAPNFQIVEDNLLIPFGSFRDLKTEYVDQFTYIKLSESDKKEIIEKFQQTKELPIHMADNMIDGSSTPETIFFNSKKKFNNNTKSKMIVNTRRPALLRRRTNLKIGGKNFYEPNKEKVKKFIVKRTPLIRNPTKMKLTGKMNFSTEYRRQFCGENSDYSNDDIELEKDFENLNITDTTKSTLKDDSSGLKNKSFSEINTENTPNLVTREKMSTKEKLRPKQFQNLEKLSEDIKKVNGPSKLEKLRPDMVRKDLFRCVSPDLPTVRPQHMFTKFTPSVSKFDTLKLIKTPKIKNESFEKIPKLYKNNSQLSGLDLFMKPDSDFGMKKRGLYQKNKDAQTDKPSYKMIVSECNNNFNKNSNFEFKNNKNIVMFRNRWAPSWALD